MNKTKIRIIIYGLLVFFILNALVYLYADDELPFSPDFSNFVFAAGNLISNFSLAVVAGLLIFIWIRSFSFNRILTRSLIAGLIGCLICVLNITIPIWTHSNITKMESILIEYSQHDKSITIEEIIRSDKIPLFKKAIISKRLAKEEYEKFGLIAEYIDMQGESKIYVPDITEVSERDKRIKDECRAFYNLHTKKNDLYYQIIFWLSVFLFSIGYSLMNRKII